MYRFKRYLVILWALSIPVQSQNTPSSLNLNQTWLAPFPAAVSSASSSASSTIKQSWNVANSYFFGDSDVSFVADPFNTSERNSVLQVVYNKGSYSPKSSSQTATTGGAEFYMQPYGDQAFDKALLTYQLAFDNSFPWTQGGKLPGLFGGPPGTGCSGGSQSNGTNCFSMRLMWRAAGAGEAYAYIPHSSSLCSAPLTMCNDEYGVSISRGLIKFTAGVWTKLQMYIEAGTAGQSNGVLKIWQDGSLVISRTDLEFHANNMIQISSIMFSTFFGGSSTAYAAPNTTYTYFKDFELSVGAPVQLTNSLAPLAFTSNIFFITLMATCAIVLLV